MSLRHKIVEAIKRIGIVWVYFVLCFGVMMLCKRLILADYGGRTGSSVRGPPFAWAD
jgi:hypothetical protein